MNWNDAKAASLYEYMHSNILQYGDREQFGLHVVCQALVFSWSLSFFSGSQILFS